METIGSILKEAREKQGKSIDDIVSSTKITRSSIAAIESDSFEFCPGHAYTKAFIKIYAEELLLDVEELAVMYDRKMSGENGIDGKTKPVSKMGVYFFLGYKKIILVVIIFLISFVFFFFDSEKEDNLKVKKDISVGAEKSLESEISKIDVPEAKEESVVKNENLKDLELLTFKKSDIDDQTLNAKRETEALIEDNNGKPVDKIENVSDLGFVEETGGFVVRFVARDLTWIKIVADDEPSEVMLRSGDSYSESAVKSMRVRIGNSGGVSLFYNDMPMGSLGKPSEPINLLFPEAAKNLRSFE